jgi:hypothetical protein
MSGTLIFTSEGKNIFEQIDRVSGPLTLITDIAPPVPEAGAQIVSPVLIISCFSANVGNLIEEFAG